MYARVYVSIVRVYVFCAHRISHISLSLLHIDIMLVDLGRNDVNRVCVPQSVTVDSLMAIEKYVCPYFT